MIPHGSLSSDHREYARAQRGRYLATAVGICPLCHSPASPNAALPIDTERVFMGLREVVPVALGLDTPADPATILTRNLTAGVSGKPLEN